MPGLGLGLGLGIGAGRRAGAAPASRLSERLLFTLRDDALARCELWLPSVEAELLEATKRRPQRMFEMSPRDFERLIASIFRNQGFQTKLTPASRDGGYDVLAVHYDELTGPSRYLIECKRYQPENKVGIAIVQRLLGVVYQEQIQIRDQSVRGIVATSSTFTRDARESAAKVATADVEHVIRLRDYDRLVGWLRDVDVLAE